MEIKVNKEIRDYTENIFFGLSLRQVIFSSLTVISAVCIYFIFKGTFNTEILSWFCIVCSFPFALLGFVKYNMMNAEEFIITFIKNELLTPREIPFESYPIYLGGNNYD